LEALTDTEFDFVIVGSGAGSVAAALVSKAAGFRPLILEKTDKIGGSTAISGGVIWIPNNPVILRNGVKDSAEAARAYLDACAGDFTPGSTDARRSAFIDYGPETIAFLEQAGMKFVHADGWSDYHEGEKPGGMARGRALVGEIFNLKELGPWEAKFRVGRLVPVPTHDLAPITLNGRTWRSRFAMMRAGIRMVRNKMGSRLVGMGASLQGRLMQLAIRADIPIWTEATVHKFIVEEDRVCGVEMQRGGKEVRIYARKGVLINAGGYAHNRAFREAHQAQPSTGEWSMSPEGDTGDLILLAESLGAATDALDLSWWNAISIQPDGEKAFHLSDLGKPHGILVDSSASRFVNEATSYVAWGIKAFERHKQVPAIPCWLVVDSRNLKNYFFAGRPPGKIPEIWLDSGYLKRADTIEELALQCGLDSTALRATINRFNGFADTGVDTDFGRGQSAYNLVFADPLNKPNPTLGRIERPPFYAVQILAGDVGTGGGLVTDEFARVLRQDGSPIPGLYAAGNSSAPVIGRSYPGAGASIGAAAVFGFIAARHALGLNKTPDPKPVMKK
jgi:3-oxosteroid 1-dehydrogenase